MVTAIDTLAREQWLCGGVPIRIVNAIYAYVDRGHSHRVGDAILPDYPPIGYHDLPLRGMASRIGIGIVDSAGMQSALGDGASCYFFVMPVSWRGANDVRVEILAVFVEQHRRAYAQRFVYLRRQGATWVPVSTETGLQS